MFYLIRDLRDKKNKANMAEHDRITSSNASQHAADFAMLSDTIGFLYNEKTQ
jgi:hypothetical protein